MKRIASFHCVWLLKDCKWDRYIQGPLYEYDITGKIVLCILGRKNHWRLFWLPHDIDNVNNNVLLAHNLMCDKRRRYIHARITKDEKLLQMSSASHHAEPWFLPRVLFMRVCIDSCQINGNLSYLSQYIFLRSNGNNPEARSKWKWFGMMSNIVAWNQYQVMGC